MKKKRVERDRKKLEDYIKVRWLFVSIKSVKEIIDNFLKHGGVLLAASISFFTILSIVPFLLVFTSIVAHIINSSGAALQETLVLIAKFFPASGDTAVDYINTLISKKVTFGIIGGIVFYLAGSMAFHIAIISIERIYEKKERGFFLKQRVLSLTIVPLMLATFALFVGLSRGLVFISKLVEGARVNSIMTHIFSLTDVILPIAIAVGFFFIIYRVFSHRNTDSISALSGAIFTSVFTMIAKYLYDWFLSNFNHYGKIYGSLSAVVVVLLWIYYMSLIFIVGAELTAFIHRKRIKNLQSR